LGTLIDTDVLIHLRDGDLWVSQQLRSLAPSLFISAITRIELENGVRSDPQLENQRRSRLVEILDELTVLDFGAREIVAYGQILKATGFSKRKTADRMTAATALVHDLAFITLNGRDFRDIPDLELIEWTRPA